MIWKSFRTSQLEYIITLGCLLIAAHNGLAAPVYDSTEIDTVDSNSCYYNYNHYYEGDRILTNEPCLNCTCHNRMLMCYLRVCPFTKPIGQDCVVERREDQCCPIITCPEVPVEINHHTTSHPITAVGGLEKYGCSIEGEFYPEGAQVPSNPRKPCELCYCIRNMTACVMQECTLHVDGCQPIYNKGVCCPVRYNCEHDQDSGVLMIDDETTTTERPTTGFMITTTVMPGAITECIHDTDLYSDGEMINTDDPCEYCYCMKGDIVCAVTECGTPLENRGKNCTAQPRKAGQCCPDTYTCEMPESTTIFDTVDLTTQKTEATTFESELPSKHADMDDSRPTTVVPELMITDSGVDEEPTPREDVQIPGRVGIETDDEKERDGIPPATTTSKLSDKEPTTVPSYTDDQSEVTTQADTEILPDDTKTPVPSIDIDEPVTDVGEHTTSDSVVPTQKIIPLDSDEPIDLTTARQPQPTDDHDVTTEINDRFGPDEVTTQKIYEVPTPDHADHELQQHIHDDDIDFTKKPPQSDDVDKQIELTTHLFIDIGTTLSPQVSDEDDKMDSEEDNTVKPYDSTTIESKDKYPIEEVTTPASSPVPTTQSDSDENITDSKLKVTSDQDAEKDDEPNVVGTTEQSIKDITSHDDMTDDDDDSKTDQPQIIPSSTLKPLTDELESTTPVHIISTENKTFKMEDEIQTEKYDSLFASFVPGEGSCLLDGVTYANNSIMPPIKECQLSCTCINSNTVCDDSRCDTSPQQEVLCDTADGKCGEDFITSTEGSAQGSVDSTSTEGDLMAPHEGSAQGEIACADDKCDGSDLIRPAQGEIGGSKPVTPTEAPEIVTVAQDEIACANGKCDGSEEVTTESETRLGVTTHAKDDESETATPVPGSVPDISTPVRSGISEPEITCADGKCDGSESETPAPGFIPEFSTPAQVGTPEAGKPAHGEITCADGKCDGSESETPAPGFTPESSTPAQGGAAESGTPVQGEITCADGNCDGTESATPAQGIGSKLPTPGGVPEFSTPSQGDGAESVTLAQDETACADEKCVILDTEIPVQGVGSESTIPAQTDGPQFVTPQSDGSEYTTQAQDEISCADGKCDISQTTAPTPSDGSKPVTPVQGDEFESSTPSKVAEPEYATPTQGDITCADGKCDEPETTTPAQYDSSESSTPVQGVKSEIVTPGATVILCTDGNCDDGYRPATPAQDELSCTDGKCKEPETVTPAQAGLPCADGKCDAPVTDLPVQGDNTCADGKCDEEGLIQPPKRITPQEGEISCENTPDGKCSISHQIAPTQVNATEDEEYSTTPIQKVPLEDSLTCSGGKCDEDILLQGVPDQAPITCTDDKCDEPVTLPQGEDLVSPSQETPTQDEKCTSGLCLDELLQNLNKTAEPINVIQVVTVLPEIQTTLKTDLAESTDTILDSSRPTSTERTDLQKTTQSGSDDDEEQTDKDSIITRIQALPTTTESGSDVDEPIEQPGGPIEQNATEKDSTVPAKSTSTDDNEVGHKTDINKPSSQVPVEQKPSEIEPIESSTMSDKDVNEMITSLPIDEIPKVQVKPTEILPAENQNEISEPDTTGKPLDAVSATTVLSDIPIPEITENPVNNLEPDTNLRTTVKPISVDESTQDATTYPSVAVPEKPTKVTSPPSELFPGDGDLDKPNVTTARPVDIDDLSDKTDSPVIEFDVQPTSAPVEKVTDLTEEVDDQDISTVGSIDKKPSVSVIKPEVTRAPEDEIPSLATTSSPGKVESTEGSEIRETTAKTPESVGIKETTTVKYTDLDNNIEIGLPADKVDENFTEKQTPKYDMVEDSTPVEELPHPTVIAPIHSEEPQNQMGVTDQNEDIKLTTTPASETMEIISSSPKSETDKSEAELDDKTAETTAHAEPEKEPTVTEKIAYRPSTEDDLVPTTMATKVNADDTKVPSRIDSDDNEIVPTTASIHEKPIDGGLTSPKADTDEEMDITTLSSATTPTRDATEKPSDDEKSTDKTIPIDSGKPIDDDSEMDVTTAVTVDKPVKDTTDKVEDIKLSTLTETTPGKDTSDILSSMDGGETTPAQEATDKPGPIDVTTPSKYATVRPSSMDVDQTPSSYATDKPSSVDEGETTPSRDDTEKVTPFDDDFKEIDIVTAGPIEEDADKPSLMDEDVTTPSKDATDKPSPIYEDQTTPSKDTTYKPSPLDDAEKTPSKDVTDKPSPLDDTATTPSQHKDDKESDIITVGPIDDTTGKPSPMDGSETTTRKDYQEEPSPIDGDDKGTDIITASPIDDDTATPTPIEHDETTPSQHISETSSPLDTGVTSAILDATDKPSPIDSGETTPSEQATDIPRPIYVGETTPSQAVPEKTGQTEYDDKESPIVGATDKPSPIDGETTPSQGADEQTTPSRRATDKPSSIDIDQTEDGIEKTTPLSDFDKVPEIITEAPTDDGSGKPMDTTDKPITDGQTTPSQDATDKPSPIDDGQTTPSKDATEKLSPFDDDEKEHEIITAATPTGGATDKPSTDDDATDKPSSLDDRETTPITDGTEKPISIDDDKEPEIITAAGPTDDATDKPSPLDDGATKPSTGVKEKPAPFDDDKEQEIITAAGPTGDATDKPSPLDDGATKPSTGATEKPASFDDDKEPEIITAASPTVDATDKPSSLDDSETTPIADVTDKPISIDDDKEPEIVTAAGPTDDSTDKPSPLDDAATKPSTDITEKPTSFDDDKEPEIITAAGPTDDATDKPSSLGDRETTPSAAVTDKTISIDGDKEPEIVTAAGPTYDATDKPSPLDDGATKPSTSFDDDKEPEIITAAGPTDEATDKPSSLDDKETTPSADVTEKTISIDDDKEPEIVTATGSTDDATDKPSPLDDGATKPSADVTKKPTSFDDDKEPEIITSAGPTEEATDKPSPFDDKETTPSAVVTEKTISIDDDKLPEIVTVAGSTDDTTDKPNSLDERETTPSAAVTEKPISIDDEREAEIITVRPSDDGTTDRPSQLDDSETPPSQEAATDKPIMDIATTTSKQATEKPVPLGESDKEMDVVTTDGTTPSKDATEEPAPIDDSVLEVTTSAQITPSKGTPVISAPTLPSDSQTSSGDIDSEKTTSIADSETTTAKVTRLTAIDDETTPGESAPSVTVKPEVNDQLGEITTPSKDSQDIMDKTSPTYDTDKDVSVTTASAEPMTTKDVTDDLSPIDDMDKEPVTTKPIKSTSEDLSEKPTPVYDIDEKDVVTITSFAPSDITTTPIHDAQQPTDKPIQIDDMDKEVPVSTTVSAGDQLDDIDVVTVIATKLDAGKPQTSTEDSKIDITESTSAPSKEPQDLTAKPDEMDHTDKEVAGSTPGQDHEIATDKPSPVDFTDKPGDSDKDMPVTIKAIPSTISKEDDKEISVTEIPSRIDDSDNNVTTQQTTPDEALVDELFTKPTEVVKKPQDGYDYQKPPQDKFDYTKQPIETTVKPETHVTQTISHPLFTTQAPTVMETPGYGAHLPPQPPQYSGNYPDEEYGEDEDPASFGPGTCRYAGKIYVSAQQIPRDDPCDFCFCFRSDIICLQQSCPPPISGCYEEPISGFCCPRYECHVKMATVLNVTTSTTTTTTTLPPHFMHHAYKGAAKRSGCQIKGQAYQVGEIISSQSGPCMRCICGGDGQMQCEPKVCSPEPMLQQMIAVAAASRRRR